MKINALSGRRGIELFFEKTNRHARFNSQDENAASTVLQSNRDTWQVRPSSKPPVSTVGAWDSTPGISVYMNKPQPPQILTNPVQKVY